MLDIKVVRENIDIVKQAMINRNKEKVDFEQLLKWDEERKFIINKI
jgi:seryl-tRNA synthetase